jgi:hypothetical protein
MKIASLHMNSETTLLYQIEALIEQNNDMAIWEPAPPSMFRKEGRFVQYHPDFKALVRDPTRLRWKFGTSYLDRFAFTDQNTAMVLAQQLSRISDIPLRVMRVQVIRVQSQIGKILAPAGGAS